MNKLKISILALGISIITISCSENDIIDVHQEITSDETITEDESNKIEKETTVIIAKDVDAAEFKDLIASGDGVLVDVRTPGEVVDGMIEGATNIDFNSEDFENLIGELDKNIPVYVYCAAGGRSGAAMNMMNEMGFVEVYNLNGGYGHWPYK